jgi:hypothetical protein
LEKPFSKGRRPTTFAHFSFRKQPLPDQPQPARKRDAPRPVRTARRVLVYPTAPTPIAGAGIDVDKVPTNINAGRCGSNRADRLAETSRIRCNNTCRASSSTKSPATYGTFFNTIALPNFANGGAPFTDPRSLSPARPRAFYAGLKTTF